MTTHGMVVSIELMANGFNESTSHDIEWRFGFRHSAHSKSIKDL